MDTFQAIAPRPAPVKTEGFVPWAKANLFGNPASTVTTLVLLGLFLWALPGLVQWIALDAVFVPDHQKCQAAREHGACWGVIAEKYRLIIFGRYPFDQQWRPEIATIALVALLVVSCVRVFWHKWLALLWLVVLAFFFALMHGGVWGLAVVPTDRWGGLPLTVMVATLSIVLAFPLAVLVALGRRSKMPAIKTVCTIYVELIRGVPLISVLFMASFMFPLFMPPGMTIDVLLRVQVGITLFSAAYLAEVVRGGLQALPRGQIEAAESLGLTYWQTTRKVVLPQALRLVVPAIMNTFIGTFKDTSLVTIVSLYDLTGALQLALGDPDWRRFFLEGQLFVAAVYFVFCFAMSRYSRWVERHLNTGTRRN